MKSLLLDRSTWDLVVDASGNIAICSDPYSILQDVACALRTWSGECWYDTSLGLPYDAGIFNGAAPISLLQSLAEEVALTVPGVSSAQCILIGPRSDRSLGGLVAIVSTSGETANVEF